MRRHPGFCDRPGPALRSASPLLAGRRTLSSAGRRTRVREAGVRLGRDVAEHAAACSSLRDCRGGLRPGRRPLWLRLPARIRRSSTCRTRAASIEIVAGLDQGCRPARPLRDRRRSARPSAGSATNASAAPWMSPIATSRAEPAGCGTRPRQDRGGREHGGSEQGHEQQQAAHAAHHIACAALRGRHGRT